MAAATRLVDLELCNLESRTLLSAVTAVDDAFSTTEDGATTLLNVLANDIGTSLGVTNIQPSANGDAWAVYTSRGFRVAYQPMPNFFGTDSFTYSAIDLAGNMATATVTVTVTPLPDAPQIAGVTGDAQVDEGAAASWAVAATDADGETLTLSWNFGDGSAPATGPAVSHIYADDGSYTLTVTAVDPTGLAATTTLAVMVRNVAPTIQALTADSVVISGQTAGFAALVVDPGADALTYTWDFGDGSAPLVGTSASIDDANVQSAGEQHTYDQPGNYTVTLTVTDGDGGQSSLSIVVAVAAPAPAGTVVQIGSRPMIFTTADGTRVSAVLAGPGTAQITYSAGGLGIDSISISGTTLKSALRLTVVGGGKKLLTLGDIRITGSLGTLVAPRVQLVGSIQATGAVRNAVLAKSSVVGASLRRTAPVIQSAQDRLAELLALTRKTARDGGIIHLV